MLGRPPAALRPRLWLITTLIALLGFVTGPANALLFVYSESVLGLSRLTSAAMVAAAGVLGLAGWSPGGGRPTTGAGGSPPGPTQAAIAPPPC